MASKQYSVWLSEMEAERIIHLVSPFGGTVGAYAATWAKLISQLPITDQEDLRFSIEQKLRRLEEAGLRDAPKIPAVPPQLLAEARKQRSQVSQQRQPARKPRNRQGKRNGSISEPHAEE